ncbi:M13 family metallopeptidase [Sphingopyxis macrogoltabida]|nr:M13 family metallopeptidase [Sphingopyxis macrogoltabida]
MPEPNLDEVPMRLLLAPILLAGTMFSAATATYAQEAAPATAAASQGAKPEIGTFGFDETGMDKSVKPGDDFYGYASGGWVKNTPMPADKAMYGSYIILRDLTTERLRGIIQEKQDDPSSKLGRAYATFMDAAKVESLGMAPIQPWLAKIRGLTDRKGYSALTAEAMQMGIYGPILPWVWTDDKQPERMILQIDQGGTGLPDRDMYLSDKPAFAKIRADYVAHLGRVLALAGETNVEARVAAVMALETEIAKAQWTREDASDMGKTYHKFTLAETAQFASPALNLQTVLKAAAPNVTEVLVREPSWMTAMTQIVDKASLEALRDQMIVRSLDSLAPALPDAVEAERFAFYDKALKGTPEREERWKRGTTLVNAQLRDEVAQIYVQRYFPPEYKAAMTDLAKNLLVVMGDRIDKLDWMEPVTKAKAKEKLKGFVIRVGYPDKFRDYAGLEVRDGDLFGNVIRANRFEFAWSVGRTERPTERSDWYMSPQTVNANATYNRLEITFPAAFLQAPAFDPKADPAVNYGAIGAIAGHEISHHFDDQGAKYNEKGILANWWTPKDLAAFDAAGKALIAQYDAYEPLPGEHVKGEFTLGENIGDLAGLTIAYDAYQRSLNGKPAPVINGYTGDQRFFLGWAQFWRVKQREEHLRQHLLTDAHSPATQRTWVVRNLDAWYKAFDVKPGDKLYLAPADRVRVW